MARRIKKNTKPAKPSGEAGIVARFSEPLDFVPDARFDDHAQI